MPVPPEQTIEAEVGFSYDYDIDFTYGLAVDANTLLASVGTSASAGQDATLAVTGDATPISASVGTSESAGQDATAVPGDATATASTGTSESVGVDATAVPGDATLAATVGTSESVGLSATIVSDAWQLDGVPIPTRTDESLTYKTLSLRFRSNENTRDTYLAPLRTGLGKHDVVDLSSGGYSTIDRAANDSSVTLLPPVDRQPPRIADTFYPADYADSWADQNGSVYDVDVTFQRDANRSQVTPAVNDTRASDEWSFAIRNQTVATKRVTVDVVQDTGGESDVDAVELTLIPNATQTEALESAATHINLVSVQENPDGSNIVRDNGPSNESTVTLTTPDNSTPVPDGDYAVESWSETDLDDDAYELSWRLLKL